MALIEKLSAIGDAIREKTNLTDLIPLSDMPAAILSIVSGGGDGNSDSVEYTSVVYNDDNTVRLIDTKGTEHIISCTYDDDDKLTSTIYDGKKVELTYNGDDLTNVGDTMVDLDNATFSGYPSIEEQEKTVDITENGTTEVLPDENKVLSKVTVNVNVAGSTEEIENLIDNSGVLEDTEGTVNEKVEQLIDKAEELDTFMNITGANSLFGYAKSFPNKAVVNLPNVTNVYRAFAYWNAEPIPIVEELTVNAPNIDVSNNQACMGQMFLFNNGVKKVVLNMPDECQYMIATFQQTKKLVEVDLQFSTKQIKQYDSTFNGSAVESIWGILDFSSATSVANMFNLCSNLKNVTFAPTTLSLSMSLVQSDKLTSESIQSIIDGLATVETAQTITFHKDVKILQSQVDSANAKGWTVAGGTVVSEEEYYG